jgi:hypothetical protein
VCSNLYGRLLENGETVCQRLSSSKLQLKSYVTDKIRDTKGNPTSQQVMPLIGQAMTYAMVKSLGEYKAAALLSQELIRYSMVHFGMVCFLLYKLIQKKNIKVYTNEQTLTDGDIEAYERISSVADISTQIALAGGDPKELIRELIKEGHISKSDLALIGAEDMADGIVIEKKPSTDN